MLNTIKASLFCVLLMITFQTISMAQSIELSDSEVEALLCKKWAIEYMEMQGMKIAPQENSGFEFFFQKEGSFEMLPINDLDPNPEMKWVYSKENKNIRLYESDHLMGKIIELNENMFIMAFESTEDLPMEGMKGYFIPVESN